MKQKYHYSLTSGWANDPNGMVYYEETYHMFYQHNYEDINHGPMSWKHVTTKDFIHFEEHPIPDVFHYQNTDTTIRWHFSGCVVWDKANTSHFFKGDKGGLVAIWTIYGGCKEENKDSIDCLQRQAIAYSYDGFTWHEPDLHIERNIKTKEEKEFYKNIILAEYTKPRILNNQFIKDDPLSNPDFRDPKVIWYKDRWILVVAGGPVRIYSSFNLIDWKADGMHPEIITECPELYILPIENTNKYKFALSEGGRFIRIGELKDINGKLSFLTEKRMPMNYGPDAYAAQSFFNTNIMVQWMNNWSYASSTSQYRGIGSILKDHNGQFTLFSKLSLNQNRELVQSPILDLHPSFLSKEEINQVQSTHFYIKTNPKDGFALQIFKNDQYKTTITYQNKTLAIDRSHSMDASLAPDDHKANGEHWKFLDTYAISKDIYDLEIFVDTYSLEIYANQRTIVSSFLIFSNGNQIEINQDAWFEII